MAKIFRVEINGEALKTCSSTCFSSTTLQCSCYSTFVLNDVLVPRHIENILYDETQEINLVLLLMTDSDRIMKCESSPCSYNICNHVIRRRLLNGTKFDQLVLYGRSFVKSWLVGESV